MPKVLIHRIKPVSRQLPAAKTKTKNMSMDEKYDEILVKIIESKEFRNQLEEINTNYNNLKQESFIQNYILEKLNEHFVSGRRMHIRAFAEHPRINKTRADLSIVDQSDTLKPFKIEFKYQFSGDDRNMLNYGKVIGQSYEFRESDLFILIISHWNKKEKADYDKKWGITSNLSRYISADDRWKDNIRDSFKQFTTGTLMETEVIKLDKPFPSEYYFYILNRI